MKSKKWMMKAMMLGSVFFIAAFFVKPVGVSTQFSVVSGMIHSIIEPGIISEDESRETGYASSNEYYDKSEGKLAKSIKNPLNYDFVFVLAIPLGAFLVSLLTKKRKSTYKTMQAMQSQQDGNCNISNTNKVDKTSNACNTCKSSDSGSFTKYLPSFVGGFLLLYGARMADGCTSGHMMSGMMQGSVSGYLFAAAVFAVAIPTAIFVGYRQNRKGGR